MAQTIKSEGKYTSKSGKDVAFEFEYSAFTNLQDMIDTLGEDKVFKNGQRMVKLDAQNTAREAAKSANGDSTRKVMSEADKAKAKADRKRTQEMVKLLLAKGVTSASELQGLL